MWQNMGDSCIADEPRGPTQRLAERWQTCVARFSGLAKDSMLVLSIRCPVAPRGKHGGDRRVDSQWERARLPARGVGSAVKNHHSSPTRPHTHTDTHTGSKNTHMLNFPHREEVSVTGARPQRFEVRPTSQTPWRSAATHAHTHAHKNTPQCGALWDTTPSNSSSHSQHKSQTASGRRCRNPRLGTIPGLCNRISNAN